MALLVRIGLAVAANAVALIVAAAVLDGFEINASGFLLSLGIFSLASLLVRPVVGWLVIRWVRPLAGVLALVTTFVVLLITDLFSDGVQIDGALTWILATAIIWLATLFYGIVSLTLRGRVLGKLRPGASIGDAP